MQDLMLTNRENYEKEFILFRLKESIYAIESKSILEITKLVNLENPEKLPRHVVGVLEFNSFFINVIDLKSVLGMQIEKYTIENEILIVSTEESIVGLVIDKVLDIKKIDTDKIHLPPYSNEFSFSSGLCSMDEDNIVIIDLNSVENVIKKALEDENQGMENLFPTDEDSKYILEARSAQLAQKMQVEQLSFYHDNEHGITFKIEEEIYCIDISYIQNFHKLKNIQNITKIPCTPSFVVGLLNVKGDFITVIDLRDYLNFGKTYPRENSIVIILEAQDYKLGILADDIGARMDITEELDKLKNSIPFDNKPEIVNFVREEVVYSILLVDEMFKNEKLNI